MDWIRHGAGLALLLLAGVSVAAPPKAEELVMAAENLRSEYAAAMRTLAAWCSQRGLADEAKKIQAELPRRDPHELLVWLAPKEVGPSPPPKDASPDALEWHSRFWKLKTEHADAMFELARKAASAKRASLAYELALAAIQANPDHEGMRRIMGHQKFKNQWCTAYEARKLRAGYVWTDRFGWIPESNVPRYERGERYSGSRWISAEEDAKLHRDIQSGWLLETEHYTIRTNHSLEQGAALGAKLERLFRVWQQTFVCYFATEAQIIGLFEGRSRSSGNPPRFEVVFYRDRDDFRRSLRPIEPNIDMAIGFYLQATGRAYFFAGEESGDRTIYHEATHQLFHHAKPVAPRVGVAANYWIVEGVALFMESLRQRDSFCVLGGLDDERVYASQVRLIRDKFYVPFSELVTYSMARLQADPRIATIYSQAAGQTHFLVFYENGRYREALVNYLSAVYSGRDTLDTLQRLTGVPYAELDHQYREYTEKAAKQKTP